MIRIPLRAVLPTAIAAGLALGASAADWPQWRGPDRDGKSTETGLLQEWPEGGPPLAWRTQGLGGGYSSVSVTGGRIITMGDLADGQYVIALGEDGGELLWKTKVGSGHQDDRRGGSRATPTVDGDRLFTINTDGDVLALEVETGKEVWRRSMVKDYGGYLMKAMGSYEWRFSESPLVDGQRVVVTPGHIEALMVALDRDTGEEIWKTQGRRLGPVGADGAGYSSAVISEAGGVRQYVQLVGRGLIGVEAETGKLLWNYNRVASDIANIPTPLVSGNFVFGAAGYGTGSALVEIKPGEDGLEAEEVYFLEGDTLQNHHGGLILHEGTVYTGTGHNKGFPIAANLADGKILWGPIRNEGRDSSVIAYADDRLYFRFADGRMYLVEATPEEYREHGTFVIPEIEKQSWSLQVIVDGKLYLREQDNL
ncbi:MAG: PQQ-binding-like beta-propeller repeat protein, partial [Thermoanaerobaculia bacterium]